MDSVCNVQHAVGISSAVLALAHASHWQPNATDDATVQTAVMKLTAVSLWDFSTNSVRINCHNESLEM